MRWSKPHLSIKFFPIEGPILSLVRPHTQSVPLDLDFSYWDIDVTLLNIHGIHNYINPNPCIIFANCPLDCSYPMKDYASNSCDITTLLRDKHFCKSTLCLRKIIRQNPFFIISNIVDLIVSTFLPLHSLLILEFFILLDT